MENRSGALALSVSLPSWRGGTEPPPAWHEMRALAQQAEAIGLDAIFVADHSGYGRSGEPATEFWDAWTLLPALAEATKRVAIGPFVSAPLLRHPVALARMVCALDEISGGRVILGLGSGGLADRAWWMLGLDPERRYSRFAESLEILVPLLREGSVDYRGQYFEARQALRGPGGPRAGAVPLWIAAQGPKMLRLAARWADAVNFYQTMSSPDEARAHIAQFESICHEAGRDPTAVQRTGWAHISFARDAAPSGRFPAITGEPAEIAAQLHSLSRAGVSHISCYINPGDGTPVSVLPTITARGLERFSEVIAALRKLERAAEPSPES
jgi:alkanesulfonate monooxygenase SsuD/methylene tetrahydromethanopterin reductase-like flavin-dependent oxidoreductase (luciferase family)